MRLIGVLAAGVRGAEDGTAEILDRAGGNLATWFTDFEGQTQKTGTVQLDGNGGAAVYANQLVRVRILSSDGVVVREVVEGDGAAATEVISTAFTGADYLTGQAGTSRPTTLQAILDAVLTSFGSIDWNVDINGTPRSVQSLASLLSVYYIVTDPTYGATGDGTTDDTTAIQAAIDAAAAAGGGTVFFPEGTYLVTSTLTVGADVNLEGVGYGASIISTNGASTTVLDTGSDTEVRGLAITASVAHNGTLIIVDGNASFVECAIGASTTSGTLIDQTTPNSTLRLRGTFLTLGGLASSSSFIIDGDTSGGLIHLDGCIIGTSSGTFGKSAGLIRGFRLLVTGNRVNIASTAATPHLLVFETADGGELAAAGNLFANVPASSFPTYALRMTATASASRLAEAANIVGTNVSMIFGTQSHKDAQWAVASKTRLQEVTGTGGSLSATVDANEYRFLTVELTDNSVYAIEWATAPKYAGEEFTVLVWNNSGGMSGNITIGATAAIGDAGTAFTMGSTTFAIADYVAVWSPSGTLRWVQRGAVQSGV